MKRPRRGSPLFPYTTLFRSRVATDNAEHPQRAPIRYGIGLHLGEVTYGNIGVPQRLEFTVIGSAANAAARVESMSKVLGQDRKSTRLNSSHPSSSYAVFCLK